MRDTYTAAPQPGLRTHLAYDQLPSASRAHEVTSNIVAPHLRAGDVVICDPSNREPMHGERLVVQATSSDRRDVVEVSLEPGGWCLIWQATVASAGGGSSERVHWCDGPYLPGGLQQRLRGRVIGILAPSPSAQDA